MQVLPVLLIAAVCGVLTKTDAFMRRPTRFWHQSCAMSMRLPTIDIRGNIEVTPMLREKIEVKIGHVIEKYAARSVAASCTIKTVHSDMTQSSKATKAGSHVVESVVTMKGGAVIKVVGQSEDMYASIDLAVHELSAKLKKHKDKARTLKRSRGQESKGAQQPDVVDPEQDSLMGDFSEYAEDPQDTQTKIEDFLRSA